MTSIQQNVRSAQRPQAQPAVADQARPDRSKPAAPDARVSAQPSGTDSYDTAQQNPAATRSGSRGANGLARPSSARHRGALIRSGRPPGQSAVRQESLVQQDSISEGDGAEFHARKLSKMSKAELAGVVERSTSEGIVHVLNLLGKQPRTDKTARTAYKKAVRAVRDYCIKNHFKSPQSVKGLVQEVLVSGDSKLKADMAVILERVDKAPGHKPMRVDYRRLMTRLMKSDPAGIVEHLENEASNPDRAIVSDPGDLRRVLETVQRYDPDAIGPVIAKTGERYAKSAKTYNKASKELIAAQKSGDPGRISAAQTAKDAAANRMLSRGRDLGYVLGSARQAIVNLAADKKTSLDQHFNSLNKAMDLTGKVLSKVIPGMGQVLAASASSIKQIGNSTKGKGKKEIEAWAEKMKLAFHDIALRTFEASQPNPAEYERLKDRFKDNYEAGVGYAERYKSRRPLNG